MSKYCQRLVSVSATGADGRPVIIPFERECRTSAWGTLLIPMNPEEEPETFDLCSLHYGEALLKGTPIRNEEL